MPNKMKGASVAALCCLLFYPNNASADDSLGPSDSFSGSLQSAIVIQSPLSMRKIRTQFNQELPRSVPLSVPVEDKSVHGPGDAFSGYGPDLLQDLEYYLKYEAGNKDPFAVVAEKPIAPAKERSRALIVGQDFAGKGRWRNQVGSGGFRSDEFAFDRTYIDDSVGFVYHL